MTSIAAVETIVDARQDRTLGPFTVGTTRLLYIANGEVRAGIDLAELGEDNVRVDPGAERVTITLPPPRILDQKVDVSRSRVYDLDESFFAPAAPDLQTQAERQALEKIVLAACEGGILSQANERAASAVEALVGAAAPYEVDVVTQPPAPGACPEPTVVPPPTP
jgi:hypothetical protein